MKAQCSTPCSARAGAATPAIAPPRQSTQVRQALGRKGEPLSTSEAAFFEPRFQRNLSEVRIHTGAEAEASARTLRAKAYTVGNNIFFGAGHFNPGTRDGRHLMAHELTHVHQQTHRPNSVVRRVPTESGIEENPPRYSYSTHCGWIDWAHANPGMTTLLITSVRQASDALRESRARGDADGDTGQFVSPAMISAPGGVTLSSVTPTVRIREPLSEDQILSVALRIFMLQSIGFEGLQAWTNAIGSSSFSEEDLPSNIISFYRAARGFGRADISRICDMWNREDSLEKFEDYDFRQNRTFRPLSYPTGGAWPAELASIRAAIVDGPLLETPSAEFSTLLGSSVTRLLVNDLQILQARQLSVRSLAGNTIDIGNETTGSGNAPHFEIGPIPDHHRLGFRWAIRDADDNSYRMWGDDGSVFQYGDQFNAYIGSGTRALLRERNIRNAIIRCRVHTPDHPINRLFTLPVTFSW